MAAGCIGHARHPALPAHAAVARAQDQPERADDYEPEFVIFVYVQERLVRSVAHKQFGCGLRFMAQCLGSLQNNFGKCDAVQIPAPRLAAVLGAQHNTRMPDSPTYVG
ncbi:hypothetical protein D3C85_1236340 [compost metagenome]